MGRIDANERQGAHDGRARPAAEKSQHPVFRTPVDELVEAVRVRIAQVHVAREVGVGAGEQGLHGVGPLHEDHDGGDMEDGGDRRPA